MIKQVKLILLNAHLNNAHCLNFKNVLHRFKQLLFKSKGNIFFQQSYSDWLFTKVPSENSTVIEIDCEVESIKNQINSLNNSVNLISFCIKNSKINMIENAVISMR